MPFLLTLNSGQEAEARKYFSPASQPATPLAPQPAPVTPAPANCVSLNYQWASGIGKSIGMRLSAMPVYQSIGTGGASMMMFNTTFPLDSFDQAFNGAISARPDLAGCKTALYPLAKKAAETEFMVRIRSQQTQLPTYQYSARG